MTNFCNDFSGLRIPRWRGAPSATKRLVDGDRHDDRPQHGAESQAIRQAMEVPEGAPQRLAVPIPTFTLRRSLHFAVGDGGAPSGTTRPARRRRCDAPLTSGGRRKRGTEGRPRICVIAEALNGRGIHTARGGVARQRGAAPAGARPTGLEEGTLPRSWQLCGSYPFEPLRRYQSNVLRRLAEPTRFERATSAFGERGGSTYAASRGATSARMRAPTSRSANSSS